MNLAASMKHILSITALAAVLVSTPAFAQTQTDTAAAPAANVDAKEKATLDKHINPVLAALKLNDAAKEAQVYNILATQLKALNTWHATNDDQIKPLWNEFNKAHGKKDDAGATAVLAKIDGVYASFKPQHDKFIADLTAVLSPEQIETVEDVWTINKVEITYRAYGQIFHGLTDDQKAFILKNLKAAREQAIDAGTMPEKSAFFKKYKTAIEAYLTAQGYDVKKSYQDFVAKQKAEAAAKDAQ